MLRLVRTQDRIFVWSVAGLVGLALLLAGLIFLTIAVAKLFLAALVVAGLGFAAWHQLRKHRAGDTGMQQRQTPAPHAPAKPPRRRGRG